MNSSNLDSPTKVDSSGTLTERWARGVLHALFSRLQHGSLTVEEAGQVLHFGEHAQQGKLRASIRIESPAAWLALLRHGEVGAGEAYMQGLWDSPDLVQLVRVFVTNMEVLQALQGSFIHRIITQGWHLLRRNTPKGARRNIAAHYDLSNDFFKLFLDDTMAYSSAVFVHPNASLHTASVAKFERICQLLELQGADHVLEIGTGWGGLAVHAAKNYGCKVTTTTLSAEQARWTREWVRREGLQQRITVLEQDYRELTGEYDKLMSIEMIEAVGADYFAEYFRCCSQLLKPAGLMMLQAITISDQRYQSSVAGTDFIKRYIFPGGQLPCNSEITYQVARQTDMQLIDLKDITLDYARTLKLWRERFQEQLPAVARLGYDETFIRMWRYYLCFCEGGFRERVIHTAQFLLAKPKWRPG